MLVYYYYQFVYKLVYYNNKTENALKLCTAEPSSSPKPITTSKANGRRLHLDAKLKRLLFGNTLKSRHPAFFADSAVEKLMYIHRSRCAEHRNFTRPAKLSKFRARSTQGLCSRKIRTQVLDTVE